MKVIIAGSRGLHPNIETIDKIVKSSGFNIEEEVCGKAPGIDTAGEEWALSRNVGVKYFPADWKNLSHPDAIIAINKFGQKYDKMAGHRRNEQMAEYADALIAIWDGKSPGTKNMIDIMRKLGKAVFVVKYNGKTFKTINV